MPTLGNNDLTITIAAVDQASAILKKVQDNLKGVSDSTNSTSSFMSKLHSVSAGLADGLNQAADAIGNVIKKTAIIAVSGAVGFGAMAKAAWDQVDAVQQATVGLKAYEKDGNKVNDVLQSLVAYAKSPMGVLFQRQDLFAAAQGLRQMGDSTGSLVDHVKTMSLAVGSGLTTWDNLTEIVQRVGSTGRLTGIDFDNLTKAGYKLDGSMRNSNVTWDSLFDAMKKGIPADSLAGQSETIKGKMIMLQSSFRNLGSEILGVDGKTSTFIKGGLGDQLVGMMDRLREVMKSPEFKEAFKKLGDDVASFAKVALPLLLEGLKWLATHLPQIAQGFMLLVGAWAALKVAAGFFKVVEFVTGIQEVTKVTNLWTAAQWVLNAALDANPIVLIIMAIIGLIAAIVLLWNNCEAFRNAVMAIFNGIWNTVQNVLKWIGDKVTWLKDHWIEALTFIVLFFATLPIMLPLYVYQAINTIINWLRSINWPAVFSAIGNAFGAVWDAMKNTAKGVWDWLRSLDWGGILKGVAKGIANGVIDFIESAINAALSGIPGSPKVHIPRFARGTNFAPGGLAIVGEEGPELVNLQRGSQVVPAKQTQQLLSSGGSQRPITITQHIYNQMDMNRSIAEIGFMLRAKA